MRSRIFQPYRAVGLVSNHVRHIVRYIHKRNEYLIVTCVGKSFHTYGSNSLHLLSVSEPHEADIEMIAADREYVYTVVGTKVRAWLRGTQLVHSYNDHAFPVHLLLPFGGHLITVDVNSTLSVWDIHSHELYSQINFSNDQFEITCLLHPSTYINKILLASRQGCLQLWNTHRSQLVYSFCGWNCAVVDMVQAPAVDTVAISLQNGAIHVHNLRADETLMTFTQDWGPATGIAFRTDGPPVMITSCAQGHLALWDLEERKLCAQMWQAHDDTIGGLTVLHAQPLMITSSADNSLKMWVFDMPDGSGRLLRSCGGHSAPPTFARFYDDHGHILSAAQDSSIRAFSSENDSVNRSFGRASYNRKLSKKRRLGVRDTLTMPPIVSFSCEPVRQKDWDNIVAVHSGLCRVTTWSYDKQRMGEHKPMHERFKTDPALKSSVCTCCDLSACGNFVVVGYSSGHVDKFNVQSGLWRGSVGGDTLAHDGPVRGVASTALVRQILTAGGDSRVRFWRFKTGSRLSELELSSPPARLLLNRHSGLLALALDDFSLLVIDVPTRAVARRFDGPAASVTDLCMSPDGHWLLAASQDACIRVWSLSQGALVDVLRTADVVTSLGFEPTGRLLVTTHVDQLGVYLWSNITVFECVSLPQLPADYMPQESAIPVAVPEDCFTATADTSEDSELVNGETEVVLSSEQIADQMLTLSLLPESRWAHVLSLEWIRRRNKPKQPHKTPAPAPFFLPSVPGLTPKFTVSSAENASGDCSEKGVTDRVQHVSELFSVGEVGEMVLKLSDSGDGHRSDEALLTHLKSLGPADLEAGVTELRPGWPDGSCAVSQQFLRFIVRNLATGRDFEFLQACLALFLKLHGSAVVEHSEMLPLLEELKSEQRRAWTKVSCQIDSSLCLVGFLKSSTIG